MLRSCKEMSRYVILVATWFTSPLAATPASAHDVWLTVDKAGTIYTAQVDFGERDAREMPDYRKIVALDLVTTTGFTDLRHPLNPNVRMGKPVLQTRGFTPPQGSVLAISYDNGFWITRRGDAADTNTVKLMVKGSSPHWTVKYGKLLIGRGSFRRVIGTRLEMVALQDPYTTPTDAKLPVRLLLDGKPHSGTKLAYADGVAPIPDEQQPTVTTDADGVALIPLRKKGPMLLTADVEASSLAPQLADHDHLFASLSFDTSK